MKEKPDRLTNEYIINLNLERIITDYLAYIDENKRLSTKHFSNKFD